MLPGGNKKKREFFSVCGFVVMNFDVPLGA
jgi:hypothetical protein